MDSVSDKVCLLVTDEWTGYRHVKKLYPHEVIKHTAGQYVVGAVHTNTIGGFWSILKRGVVGTYHKVSKNTCRFTLLNSVPAQQSRERRYFRIKQAAETWSLATVSARDESRQRTGMEATEVAFRLAIMRA
jgi:hypothetical protein